MENRYKDDAFNSGYSYTRRMWSSMHMLKEDGFLSLYMTYICLHFQIRQMQYRVKTAVKK